MDKLPDRFPGRGRRGSCGRQRWLHKVCVIMICCERACVRAFVTAYLKLVSTVLFTTVISKELPA